MKLYLVYHGQPLPNMNATFKESEENCVFCKILKGELPVSMIYADEKTVVFVDLSP